MGVEVSSTNAGAVGTMTCEVLYTGMHGCMKADDNDEGVGVRSHGVGDRCRRRVVRTQECMGMGKSRCV